MKQLGMQSLKQLVLWSLTAKKNEIAELAPLVLLLWKQKDEIAQIVINDSITDLSDDCVCLIGKLSCHPASTATKNATKFGRVSIGLIGSLFSKDIDFADAFKRRLNSELLKHGGVTFLSVKILQNTALGSLRMIDPLKWKTIPNFDSNSQPTETLDNSDARATIRRENDRQLAENILPVALGLPLTEKRNEKSMNLDRMDVKDAIDLMIVEEQSIFNEIAKNKKLIEILVEKVCGAFQNGGRLFYVGAGTSGRLGNFCLLIQHKQILFHQLVIPKGILDASECPPTFRSPNDWVQGIIAGGFSSIGVAKEGAEDSILDGMNAINEKNVNDKDVVVGKS